MRTIWVSRAGLLCGLTMAVFANVLHAAPAITLQGSEEGRVTARSADNQILWQVNHLTNKPARVESAADGRILVNGEFVLDRNGRVLERVVSKNLAVSSGIERASVAVGWEKPVTISSESEFTHTVGSAPLADSKGNVWAILFKNGIGDQRIEVAKWEAQSGLWASSESIYGTENFLSGIRAVIDSRDRITVVYREIRDSMNYLEVVRYLPDSGWQDSETIHSTDEFFQQVDIAVDAQDNVVVSFDPEDTRSMFAVVYDAATDRWGEASRVSQSWTNDVRYPTLIQNRAGNNVYAVYQIGSGQGRGIYVRRFLSGTLAWALPQRVPGARDADLPGGTGSRAFIKATVDDFGDVTVPFYFKASITPFRSLWILLAVRFESGTWTAPARLLVHQDDPPLLTQFADADYSATGDVAIVFKRTSRLTSFRTFVVGLTYNAAAGAWDAPATLYADDSGTSQLTQTVFRSDGRNLATYVNANRGQLSSRLYDGRWSLNEFDVPGGVPTSSQETMAVGMDVIMIHTFINDALGAWFRDDAIRNALQ